MMQKLRTILLNQYIQFETERLDHVVVICLRREVDDSPLSSLIEYNHQGIHVLTLLKYFLV